jgi:hypothetical protein
MNKVVFGCLLLTGLCWPVASHGQSGPDKQGIKPYRWQNRLLLVFAPSGQNDSFQHQQDLWRDQVLQLKDRDLLVLPVVGSQPVKGPGQQPLTPASLRELFQVSEEEFAVVLVGKDGTEKYRTSSPVAPRHIYGIIDTMPMRQSEMRKKN